MPLSYDKINKLLASKGFLILKKFIKKPTDGKEYFCSFLEVISIKRGETFILYIPSKYEMIVPKSQKEVYKIKREELSQTDVEEIHNTYSQIKLDVEFEPGEFPEDVKKKMDSQYKEEINIKREGIDEKIILEEIYQQLKRFRYCVRNLPYQLAILYSKYLCILSEDEVDIFSISEFQSDTKERKLFIYTDIDKGISKLQNIENDIKKVRGDLFKILDRNSLEHISKLEMIFDKKMDFVEKFEKIDNKRKKFSDLSDSFEELLSQTINSQNSLLKSDSERKIGGNIWSDTDKINNKLRIEREYQKINDSKNEILEKLLLIRDKESNISLMTDKIFFDNIIMLNKVLNNLNYLEKMVS